MEGLGRATYVLLIHLFLPLVFFLDSKDKKQEQERERGA